jgi:hypothetical protein
MVENFARSPSVPGHAAAQFARRACLHIDVVVIEVRGPPFGVIVVRARCLLLVDVGHILFAEGSVVEPVVAHPAVDHGIHGHGHLQSRVRMTSAIKRKEAVIGDAENPHLAVGLGNF